jgi:hypothetical protein
MSNNLVIKRSQLVEFPIVGTPATLRRYKARTIPNLSRNNIILYGIECYTEDQLAQTPSGEAVIDTADANQVVLTLMDTDKNQFIYNCPIISLIRENVGGFVTIFKPRLINLNDCYIQLTDATGITAGENVVFNFYYELVGE